MLVSALELMDYPVLSLHLGAEIGATEDLIIDPARLQIVGFFVGAPADEADGDILETRDVRELAPSGMIIDSGEVLELEEDAIRLKEVLELEFRLIGLKVETKEGTKLGKVIDYIVETDSYKIVQLIVKRPLLKALNDPELVIPRSEIVEVADTKIIVKDEEEKIRQKAAREAFTPNFVNPFREQRQATAHRTIRKEEECSD